MAITHPKGDLSPSLADTIRIDGVAFSLTGSTVKLRMRAENSSTLKIDTAATVVTAASTLASNVSLPERSISVADASGFLSSGALLISGQIVEYEEISGNTFLGCEGGAGTISSGTAVAQIGGVRFDWVSGNVDTAGDFNAWWRVTLPSAKTQDTPEFAVIFTEHVPSQRGLCSLEEIQSYVPGYRAHSDRDTDAILRELIASVSTEMQNEMGREVLPVVADPSAKVFDLSAWEASQRKMWVGDLKNTTTLAVVITQQDGTAVATLAMTDDAIVALPRNRQEWQPYNHLSFPSVLADAPALAEGYIVTVTGNWGFQSIPSDIKTACIKLVILRYLRDVASAGTALSDALGNPIFDLGSAFASARDTIESYTMYSIA